MPWRALRRHHARVGPEHRIVLHAGEDGRHPAADDRALRPRDEVLAAHRLLCVAKVLERWPGARVDRAAHLADCEEILVGRGDGDLGVRQRSWAKTRNVGRPTGSSENSGFTQPRSSVRWW